MKTFFVMSFTLLLVVKLVTTATLAGANTAVPSNNANNLEVPSVDANGSDDPTKDANIPDNASKVDMSISVPSKDNDGTDNHLEDNQGKLDHAQNRDISNVMPKGDVNADRNLKQDDQLTQLVSLFLKTKMSNLDSMRGELYCNTNSATMADCTIYVRAGEGTIQISQNTIMERVLIICMGTQDNCMQVASGVSLQIHTAVISGNRKGRFIYMGTGSELVLRDVEGYEFGRTNLNGGFICAPGTNKLEITNSTIRNNQASHGGGVWLDASGGAGELTIYNTVFEANSAIHDGGAIWCQGVYWGHVLSRAIWNIQKATFKENTSTRYGGGIFAYYTTATVSNTQFNENAAKTGGGGVAIGKTSIFTFQCSSFTSNKVSGNSNGAAVYSEPSSNTEIKLFKTMLLDNKDKDNKDNDIYCVSVAITRDMYTSNLKTPVIGSCTYQSIPPFSKDNVDCTPSA